MAFDAAERNGRFGRIQCQRSKESSSREKRKRRVFLCRMTVRVKVRSKVIPSSFLYRRASFVIASAPINSYLNVVVRSLDPDPVWVGSKWLLDFPRVLVTSGTILHFFTILPPERLQKGSTQLLQNRSPVFTFSLLPPFPFPSSSFNLLLLLMSSDVHPKPGPIFPCSVCAGNVSWWGRSVQCCTCSKWVHLRCSQLSLSKFSPLGSYHSWSFPLATSTLVTL